MVRIRNLGNQKTYYIFFINSSNCSSDRYAMLSALAAFNDFKTAVVLPLTMMLEKTLESAMGEAIPAHLSTAKLRQFGPSGLAREGAVSVRSP